MPFEGYKRRDENSGYLQAGVIPKTTQNADGTLTQHVNIDSQPTGTVIVVSQPTGTVFVVGNPSVSVSSLPTGVVVVASLPTGSVNVVNFPSDYNILFSPSNMSAFGTLETAEKTPVFQGDWVYGLNTQIWQTPQATGTGAVVDTDSARLRIQSGTTATSYAYIVPRRTARYRAGQGMVATFTPIFTTGSANNIQYWGMGSITTNAITDGYGFMYNGATFGIGHYVRGVLAFTALSSWNGVSASWYDPTKGTPAMIKYPYLGFGDIEFFLQNPTTGRFDLVHVIRYANTVATTQLANPSLHFIGFTANSGNTSNKIMYCGSVGIFISGIRSFVGNPKWAADVSKTGITTEALALSIKNCTTYNGIVNRGLIRIHSIGLGSNTNTYGVLRFKINAAIGGTPSFAAVSGSTADNGTTITSGNSIASVDTAGTTITGGTYVWNMPVGATGSQLMDITPFEIFIAPGEILNITLFAANALSSNVSVNWSEDI